jgi:hypothetical protein
MKRFGQDFEVLRMPHEVTTTGAEYFSMVDAASYEEEIIEGYRGDIDANAMLPPLPHDNYCVRIMYAEKWPNGDVLAADPGRRWVKKIAKDGGLLYMTWIRVVTENNANELFNGRERSEVLTTYATKQGTTATQALLQGLGVDTIMLNSHAAQIKAVDAVIGGEGGVAGAEYDWEATVFDKEAVQRDKQGNPIKDDEGNDKKGVERWRLRGMQKFPKNEDGTYRHEIVKADGFLMKGPDGAMIPVEQAYARNFIRRWVPVGKLTATPLEQQLAASVQQVQEKKVAAGQAAAAPVPVATLPPRAPMASSRLAPVRRVVST